MKFPIPDDWDGESWCKWSVCWPASEKWEGFLRGLLTIPQRGRTWDERTGTITDVQEIGREIAGANLPLVGVFMACNDTELVSAFNEIAASIRYMADRQFAKDCCVDGISVSVSAGYAGSTVQPGSGATIPIYGSAPPAILPEGETFPEGFESAEEWNQHKCSIANLIFDGVLYTLSFLAGLSTTNITVLAGLIGAGIAGILVFPPVAIGIMVGAVFALFGFLGMFLQIRLEMIERRDEFICVMYEAESVESVVSILADLMDVIIALVTTVGPLAAAIKTVLLLLFNSDALNQLFDPSADYAYPDADCSNCVGCQQFYWEFETGADGFVTVGALPGCFGLSNTGNAALSVAGGILSANVSGGGPNPEGAFGKTGIDYLVADDTNLEVTLRTSGAGGLYIDTVIVFDDSTCAWHTLSTSDPAGGVFHGLSIGLVAYAGKRINELYFYLQSGTAGPDGTFLTEFEKIGFFCG